MRRVVSCVLSFCVLASLAFLGGPANAGDDYAYRPQRQTRVWYTSDCCYRKIVRDVTTVRYVRVKRIHRRYRTAYHRPYRYRRPWHYHQPHYGSAYGAWNGPRWRYANYLPPPDCRLVRLTDGAGGWIWARRAGCF